MEKIKKFLFSPITLRILRIDVILSSLALIAFIVASFITVAPVQLNTKLLFQVDSIKANKSDILKHNEILITFLEERESADKASVNSHEDGLRQSRSVYLAIIGVMFTIIFRAQSDKQFHLVTLLIITLMYGLDIHLEDLIAREQVARDLDARSTESLINFAPTDTTWISFHSAIRDSLIAKSTEGSRLRKLTAATKPNLFQLFYFLVPFIVVYWLGTSDWRKIQPPALPAVQADGNSRRRFRRASSPEII